MTRNPPRNSDDPLSGPSVVIRDDPRGRPPAENRPYPELNLMLTAEKIGVARDHLDRILKGTAKPSWSMAVRIAKGLGISLTELEETIKEYAESHARSTRNGKRKRKRPAGHHSF